MDTFGTVYQNMLDEVIKPLNETLFDREHWVFQQDSTPDMELVPPKISWK